LQRIGLVVVVIALTIPYLLVSIFAASVFPDALAPLRTIIKTLINNYFNTIHTK